MSQPGTRQGSGSAPTSAPRRVELDTSLGYLLKQVDSVLRSRMDAVLRPLGLSVAQYACLELLAQRSGLSNSALARGAFVSRQAMNLVLQGLEREGLVRRVATPASGRSRPGRLTPKGARLLARASAAVAAVEARMTAPLQHREEDELRRLLCGCLAGLDGDADDPPDNRRRT